MNGFLTWLNPLNEMEEEPDPRTPMDLHNAALWGDAQKIKLLIEGRADVNELSHGGGKETPLMWAAQEGHTAAVLLLLDCGARTSLKNGAGLTATDLAKRQGHEHTAQ
jgi:ankyrin repeat protein